jgi:hypothetical protein
MFASPEDWEIEAVRQASIVIMLRGDPGFVQQTLHNLRIIVDRVLFGRSELDWWKMWDLV